MHTSSVTEGGRDYRAQLSSDLSGEVRFTVDGVPTDTIPGRLLLQLVGDWLRDRQLARLQNVSGRDFLESLPHRF